MLNMSDPDFAPQFILENAERYQELLMPKVWKKMQAFEIS